MVHGRSVGDTVDYNIVVSRRSECVGCLISVCGILISSVVSVLLRQLHATDRIFVFRNAVRLNYETAAIALRDNHYAAAVAQIADAAMNGYHYFRDIAPDEPAIVNAFRATMLLETTSIDRHQLLEDVLIYIRQTERHPPNDLEPYCRELILTWVGD